MKTVLCLLTLMVGVAWADDRTTNPATGSQLQTTRKGTEPVFMRRSLLTFTGAMRKPNARYGGFLTDFTTSPAPLRMIDPFLPANAGLGSENLIYDVRTGRPRGFALFTIRF